MVYGPSPVAEYTVSCFYHQILYPRNCPAGITEDGTWRIIRYREKDNGRDIVASGVNLPAVPAVETVLYGTWSANERYGRTLKVSAAELVPPVTEQVFLGHLHL